MPYENLNKLVDMLIKIKYIMQLFILFNNFAFIKAKLLCVIHI